MGWNIKIYIFRTKIGSTCHPEPSNAGQNPCMCIGHYWYENTIN